MSVILYWCVFLGSLMAGLHWLAIEMHLYWYYWWFDVVMHILGGTVVTLMIYSGWWLIFRNQQVPLRLVIVSLGTVTIGWEVFEWYIGITNPKVDYLDTIHDIVLGFSSGLMLHILYQHYSK